MAQNAGAGRYGVLRIGWIAGAAFGAGALAPISFAQSIEFESPHVHPIDITPDGTRLLVAHTADQRLVVFDLEATPGPVSILEVNVGLDPVSVRARTDTEAWVVNHVSDSISIVDLATANVTRTLLVGDEPTDVVFAGLRAFVCVGGEDRIRAYHLDDLEAPPVEIALTMADPRALALSPDGSTIWVGAFDGQNETTVISPGTVLLGGGLPPPNPPMRFGLPPPPAVGLIVKHDGTHWVDEIARSWDAALPYTLLDHDVIGISTTSFAVTHAIRGVGTTLFNLAVSPANGSLYVTNQEAFNEIRFEPNLKGRFLQNRLTIVEPTGSSGIAIPRHLNEHIDYENPAGSPAERALSLSFPLDVVVSADGQDVYVAAFGSSKVGVLDASGNVVRRIQVGQGPSGLALDEPRKILYVLNRFTSTLSIVSLGDDSSTEIPIAYDPTSPEILAGRHLLYDGAFSSAHGDLSCGSCHLFGGMDQIAWDLGDPQGDFVPNGFNGFHPMKGPLVTQSLKSLEGTEPLHWRGDRASLAAFSPAFVSLMGRSSEPSAAEFQTFEDFVFSLRYPPNPHRSLDGTLPNPPAGPSAVRGHTLFTTARLMVGGLDCSNCHTLPTGENEIIVPRQVSGETQDLNVPQLRNLYQKTRFEVTGPTSVRGFGFTHDGTIPTLMTFLQSALFRFTNDDQRRDVEAFLLALGVDTHPAIGAQWTMDGKNEAEGLPRLNVLMGVADAGEIGLFAKGRDAEGLARGWMYEGAGVWQSDRESDGPVPLGALLAIADVQREITFTAAVLGAEFRMGIDRDGDGFRDRDEIEHGSEPDDPFSIPDEPLSAGTASGSVPALLTAVTPNPVRSGVASFSYRIEAPGPVHVYVHDVRGRLVRTLVAEPDAAAGATSVAWDLRDERGVEATSGVYFVRVRTASGHMSRSFVVSH
jgi:YVTN family beta-propeller protein